MNNVITEDAISGNIISTISITWSIPKKNFFQTDLKKKKKKKNWESLFSEHKQDVNLFYKLLNKIIHLLNMHAPIMKLSIKEKKIWKNHG